MPTSRSRSTTLASRHYCTNMLCPPGSTQSLQPPWHGPCSCGSRNPHCCQDFVKSAGFDRQKPTSRSHSTTPAVCHSCTYMLCLTSNTPSPSMGPAAVGTGVSTGPAPPERCNLTGSSPPPDPAAPHQPAATRAPCARRLLQRACSRQAPCASSCHAPPLRTPRSTPAPGLALSHGTLPALNPKPAHLAALLHGGQLQALKPFQLPTLNPTPAGSRVSAQARAACLPRTAHERVLDQWPRPCTQDLGDHGTVAVDL